MTNEKDYFKTFCKISKAFGKTLNKEQLLDLVAQSAIDSMDGKGACLFLSHPKKDVFIPVTVKGLSRNLFSRKSTISVTNFVDDIMKHGGYLKIKDATSDSRLEYHDAIAAEGIKSILVVPVEVRNKIIGVLALYTSQERDFTDDEAEFLMALAEQGGMAIENSRLFEEILRHANLFHDISVSINSSLDIHKIMDIMTEDIAKELDVKAVSIRLLDNKRKNLKTVASYGLSDKYLNKGPISAEKSINEALKGEPVVVKDASKDPGVQYREEKKEEGIASILCVPIKAKDEVIGVMRLYTDTPRDFTKGEIILVTALAHQGGLAIQNASKFLQMKEEMKDMEEEAWSHRSWF